MTSLTNKTDLTSPSTTEASFQAGIGALHDVVREMPGGDAPQTITISAGSIVPSTGIILVDTEASASTDNLDHIVPTNLGQKLLYIQAANAARTVVLRHNQAGSGKLILKGGVSANLDDDEKSVLLRYDQSLDAWVELQRSWATLGDHEDVDTTTTPPTVGDTLTWNGTIWVPAPAGGAKFVLQKANWQSVALAKTGTGAAEITAGTEVVVGDTLVEFASNTAITMPGTLTAGTDYAVWVKEDGTIQADASHTAAPGSGLWRKIGGFHYAPSNLDIDSTNNINAYSMWDLKWRPTCPDPRGMALVAGSFWCDIYLCNTDPDTNGTSKLGATIADGSSPPKIPLLFGGDGSADYGSFTWYEAAEIMMAHGKQLLSYDEFAAAMYGTTEASSIGTDQITTKHNSGYTSQFGVEQATGIMYVWGRGWGSVGSVSSWSASTEGRGSYYAQPNAALFGGSWSGSSDSGSRCSNWNGAPSLSSNNFGARGRCDHYRGI